MIKCQTSELLNPKNSIFKKKPHNNSNKTIFNIINIQESIFKNKLIDCCNKESFFYRKELSLKHKENTWRRLNDNINEQTHINYIVELKNSKETRIDLNELIFENQNGFTYNFLDKYYIIDIIGSGGFGLVLKCWCKTTKQNVAVKIINKNYYNKSVLKCFEVEKSFLIEMNHENIVRIIKVEESDSYLLLVLELMEWCTLKQLIIQRYKDNKLFSEHEIALIIKNILEGLTYMHGNNIMHRDIKPDNIMFKKINDLNSLKIIDFGLATYYEGKIKGYCGTFKFMSPEIINNKQYDQTIDNWATGLILYILCSGGEHPLGNLSNVDQAQFRKLLSEVNDKWKFHKSFPM